MFENGDANSLAYHCRRMIDDGAARRIRGGTRIDRSAAGVEVRIPDCHIKGTSFRRGFVAAERRFHEEALEEGGC